MNWEQEKEGKTHYHGQETEVGWREAHQMYDGWPLASSTQGKKGLRRRGRLPGC